MKPSTQKRKREEKFVHTLGNSTNNSIANPNFLSTSIQTSSIKFTITEHFEIHFANEKNKSELAEKVENYLENDFYEKEEPTGHFYHNKGIVAKSFEEGCGMVVLNEKAHIVGFMTWVSSNKFLAEIHIVEVQDKYRGKGIFNKMLSTFISKYDDIHILTAFVIPQSHAVFKHLGWTDINPHKYDTKYFYKIVKKGLEPVNELPDGRVIAICPASYYEVKNNLDKYQSSMKYYKIDLDENQNLNTPILAEIKASQYGSSPESHVGVYYNKELVTSGKAIHIFKDFSYVGNLLIIYNAMPTEEKEKQFIDKGFFENDNNELASLQAESKRRKTVSTNPQTSNRYLNFNNYNVGANEEEPEEKYEKTYYNSNSP